jgi:DNA polymerase alpha subunit B
MFIACGPYTRDMDLDFSPWRALVEKIKTQRPDVVLLVRFCAPSSKISRIDTI